MKAIFTFNLKSKLSLFALCILTVALSLITTGKTFSQGTAINSSGAAADASAILDVSSTTRGLLIPRMTETDRVTIASPATGLMVYQTDVVKGFYYHNGTAWTYIGADNLGNHTATDSLDMANYKIKNLTTCTANLDAANKWYVDNAVSAGGGGGGFTITQISHMIYGGATMVWTVCADSCYNLVENGYSDWRMPTLEEAIYYRTTFTPPVGGWPYYFQWSQSTSGANWRTYNEQIGWLGTSTYNDSRSCRCVR